MPHIGPLEEIKLIASVYGCLFYRKKLCYMKETAGKFKDILSSLDTYITNINKEVEKFNRYMKLNY